MKRRATKAIMFIVAMITALMTAFVESVARAMASIEEPMRPLIDRAMRRGVGPHVGDGNLYIVSETPESITYTNFGPGDLPIYMTLDVDEDAPIIFHSPIVSFPDLTVEKGTRPNEVIKPLLAAT